MKRTMTDGEKLTTRSCKVLRVAGYLTTRDIDGHQSMLIDPDFSLWLRNPIITLQHDPEVVIGVGRKLSVPEGTTDTRLEADFMDAEINEKVADGRLRGLSLGFDETISYKSNDVTVYVRPTVREVALCSLPSNSRCVIDTVSCANQQEPK